VVPEGYDPVPVGNENRIRSLVDYLLQKFVHNSLPGGNLIERLTV
jgi:hypothetical protein